jgi:hypothetical protein
VSEESRGLEPHAAFTARLAFQAISAPGGFAFRSSIHSSGRHDLSSKTRCVGRAPRSHRRSPVPQSDAFAWLSYALRYPRSSGPDDRPVREIGSPVLFVLDQDAGVSRLTLSRHAESGADTPKPSQYGCQMSGRSPSSRRIGGTTGREVGFFGCRSSFMPACSGVRLPLRSLHA